MAARQRRFPTSITPAEPFAADELPFEQLSRMLATINLGSDAESIRLCNVPASYPLLSPSDDSSDYYSSLTPPSLIQANLSSDLAVTFNQQVLPHLQALFPRSAIDKLMLDGPEDADELNRYSSAQVQFLIYAATNNLPGTSQSISLTSIYDYLKEPVRAYFKADSDQLSAQALGHSLPCTKAMAETMFRCAIEAGDHELVHQLLTHHALGLDANDQICMIRNEAFTPVERSAALDHIRMVRMLVSMGADVNKTHRNIEDRLDDDDAYVYGAYGPPRQPRGALEQAIDVRLRSTSASLETIELLLQAGGNFHVRFLNALMRDGDTQAGSLLIAARFYVAPGLWLNRGCLHGAIHRPDQEGVMNICDKLQDVGLDVNHDLVRRCAERNVWHRPLAPQRFLDIAIERGFVEVVKRLRDLGASFTHDSMTAAVRSRDPTFIQHILSLGAVADCYSAHFRTTAIAEAVRIDQRAIYQLLVNEGCMQHIHEEYHFCSMLASAAEAGNAEMVDFLLSLDTPNNENHDILGYALSKATEANHTDIAIRLVEAGAAVDGYASSRVLGYVDSAERSSAVMFALEHQNIELFDVLFEHWQSPNMNDRFATLVVEHGNISILDRLVDTGVDMTDVCKCAVTTGNLAIMRHLYSRGVTMSINTGYSGDLLTAALEKVDTVMALELISYGIEPGPDALVVAVLETPSLLVPLLQKQLAAEQSRPDRASIATIATRFLSPCLHFYLHGFQGPGLRIQWITPLGAGILKDNGKGLEMVQILLDRAPDLDRPAAAFYSSYDSPADIQGSVETVLLLAVGTCEPAMVQMLLRYGADKAAEVGAWTLVSLLLDHGADATAPPAQRDGGMALQLAAKGGYIGIAELLLEAGADIQAAGSKAHGRTALEAAAENGQYDMVKFLTLRTKYSDTQFDKAVAYAREKSHNAVADLLLALCAEQHVQILAVRDHLCVDCTTTFSNAFTLKRHQQTAHGDAAGRPRHTCRICSRVFKRKDMMDRHVEAHEGAGRVGCPQCAKTFSRADTLKAHLSHCEQTGPSGL
ncbi:hypothetical protein LTR15_012002 [Elasticomyces elasticus]|nr:hypothetical protein LTR15_012002 [Elasticomyces elasticus]